MQIQWPSKLTLTEMDNSWVQVKLLTPNAPVMNNGVAEFDYNWSWYSQYGSGTYGMRVDFTNSAYYFTGKQFHLGSDWCLHQRHRCWKPLTSQTTSLPRLYRNSSTTIQAKLV